MILYSEHVLYIGFFLGRYTYGKKLIKAVLLKCEKGLEKRGHSISM